MRRKPMDQIMGVSSALLPTLPQLSISMSRDLQHLGAAQDELLLPQYASSAAPVTSPSMLQCTMEASSQRLASILRTACLNSKKHACSLYLAKFTSCLSNFCPERGSQSHHSGFLLNPLSLSRNSISPIEQSIAFIEALSR